MKNFSIVEKAILKAMSLHSGQVRKGDGATPFIVHPLMVGLILARWTRNEDIIAAGILHDTLEDTPYTKQEMLEDFGEEITSLVDEVTEPSKEMPWKDRKVTYLEHLKEASLEACAVCLADKIHNVKSLIDSYQKEGEAVWKRFNGGNSLWFYDEILAILSGEKDLQPIVEEYRETLKEAKECFHYAPPRCPNL